MKKLGCSYTFPDLIFKGLAYFYDFIVSSLFPPPPFPAFWPLARLLWLLDIVQDFFRHWLIMLAC